VLLSDIKKATASYLQLDVADLTQNGLDLFLVAVNQARAEAELLYDFEFTRTLAELSVDGSTGGSLVNTVLYGTATAVEVKSIVEVGIFDTYGNLLPVEWTTIAESLERQRVNPHYRRRNVTDGNTLEPPGRGRFTFAGDRVLFFPKTAGETFLLGMEIYAMTTDWDADTLAETTATDPWLSKGSSYLQWRSIIHMNYFNKQFISRQEGNLPPPQELADRALASFREWDVFRFEQFRRHGR